MKLNIYCKYCQTVNFISDKGILDRKDLEHIYGDEIKFSCISCSKKNSRSVRQVFATESKFMFLICGLIGFAFIGVSVLFLIKDETFIIWPFLIGGLIMTAGFFSNHGSNSTTFNKS